MKKRVYVLITIMATIAAMTLQGVWFGRTYALMNERLQRDINEQFNIAVTKEMYYRFENASISNESVMKIAPTVKGRIRRSLHDNEYFINYTLRAVLDSLSVPIEYAYLDSTFCSQLALQGVEVLSYKIDTAVAIDTTHYRYIEDLLEDSTLVCNGQMIQSYVSPWSMDFTKGVRVTVFNPYREILGEMFFFLIGTLFLFVIILLCIIHQINIIRRQNKISQLREDFSYAMIHDMKTPLSSIIMSNHTLGSGKLDEKPEVRKNFHSIIAKESEHLLSLTNKVLTISKLEHEKMKMANAPVLVPPLVEEMIEKFKAIATKSIRFETEFKADTIWADKEFLQEALSNLIDNAVKYSRQDISIRITAWEEGDYCLISVRDNGIGIPAKDLSVIFNKFERVSSVRSGKGGRIAGFGLGLNYVYQVMQAHGGKVSVESREGEYSEFTLHFPRS